MLFLGTQNCLGKHANCFEFYSNSNGEGEVAARRAFEKVRSSDVSAVLQRMIVLCCNGRVKGLAGDDIGKLLAELSGLIVWLDERQEASIVALVPLLNIRGYDTTMSIQYGGEPVSRHNPIVNAMGQSSDVRAGVACRDTFTVWTQDPDAHESYVHLLQFYLGARSAAVQNCQHGLVWDIACALAVQRNIATWSEYKARSSSGATAVEKMVQLLRPLLGATAVGEAIIIALQEAPPAIVVEAALREVSKVADCQYVVTSVDAQGFETGVVYSNCQYCSTQRFVNRAAVGPDEIEAPVSSVESQVLNKKEWAASIASHYARTRLVRFDIGCVLACHLTNFKSNAALLGPFLCAVLDAIDDNAAPIVGIVGDFNVEPSGNALPLTTSPLFAEGFTGSLQATFSCNVAFERDMAGRGFRVPSVRSGGADRFVTSCKMRTSFQGQPGKTDKPCYAAKDYIFAPGEAGFVMVSGSGTNGVDSSRDYLQSVGRDVLLPTRVHPSDHAGLIARVVLPPGTRVRAEAVLQPQCALDGNPVAAGADELVPGRSVKKARSL